MNRLPLERRAQIIGLLAEGNGLRAASAVADDRGVVQRESAGARIFGRPADRPGIGVRQVLRRGELREDAARPGGQQIAQDGAVLGQHHVERRDELTQVVLAVEP